MLGLPLFRLALELGEIPDFFGRTLSSWRGFLFFFSFFGG